VQKRCIVLTIYYRHVIFYRIFRMSGSRFHTSFVKLIIVHVGFFYNKNWQFFEKNILNKKNVWTWTWFKQLNFPVDWCKRIDARSFVNCRRGVNHWWKLCTLMPTNAQFLGITAKFLKFNHLTFNKFKIIIWKKRLNNTLITSMRYALILQ